MIGCGEGSRKIVMEISLWMIVAEVAPSKAYWLLDVIGMITCRYSGLGLW